jgi:fructose-1,6-bisphosphatase/inositol monophosphatase family enzyme
MEYKEELEFAISTAKAAGDTMRRYFRSDDLGTEWKEDVTPITLADTTINDFVIQEVKKHFPSYGVHGEEGSFAQDREYVWVCDPVDGTMPYSIGVPISTHSLALTKNGRPLLGVVYDPFQDRLFTAIKGEGAFLNGKPIHVSSQSLAGSYVDLELLHTAKGAVPVSDFRSDLAERHALPFTFYSFVIAAMLVATGELTAAFFGFKKPEDLAAAKVIVEEAGGQVTDITGADQRYDRPVNGGLLTNGIVHKEMLSIIKAHMS